MGLSQTLLILLGGMPESQRVSGNISCQELFLAGSLFRLLTGGRNGYAF